MVKTFKDITDTGEVILDKSYSNAIQGINIAMAVTTAMSYHEVVKEILTKYIDINKNGIKGHIMYAFAISVVASLVFLLTDKYESDRIKSSKLVKLVRS